MSPLLQGQGELFSDPNPDKLMRVISHHPGYTFKHVQENCGFKLLMGADLGKTLPPTENELWVLRSQVDPYRYVLGL